MILNTQEIKENLAFGGIIVADEDGIHREPRTLKDQSIDVRIGRWLYVVPVIGDTKWVDLEEGYQCIRGEFYIAHTEEFIGTAKDSGILPSFKLKSSAGRLGIVHTLAGHGEIGFHNRWAMEFVVGKPILLKRSMAIGQIYFTQCTSSGGDYAEFGTYQSENNIYDLMRDWKKEDILPKSELKIITSL